jgi:3-(3-hydroxy-phenyl)propionate hydroxylase
MVAKGIAPTDLLSDYSTERVGAAREIIDEAGKSTRFMTPPTEGFRLLRNAVLSLSLTHEFVRPLYHWRTSRPHAYAESRRNSLGDDNALFQSGPGHGEPPKNVQIGSNHYLLDHLASVFTLLYFSQSSSLPQALTEVIDSHRGRGMPITILIVGSAEREPSGNPVLADASGRIRQSYGVSADGAAYLLRPDQHICARWLTLDADRLDAALRNALPEKS